MKSILYVAAALALTACAQSLPIKGNGANMEVRLSNESTRSYMQNWQIRAFEDERCEKEEIGVLLANKSLSRGATSLNPITLPTASKVTLGFRYLDARLGVTGVCDYAFTFTPVENQRYQAHFAVRDDAASCKVDLLDSAGRTVEVSTPAQACVAGMVATFTPNGQGNHSQAPMMRFYTK